MMADEYKHGMVSQFLGGGKETSEGKLAAFFSVPAAMEVSSPQKPKSAQSQKKKRKVVPLPAEDMESSPPRKKVKARVHGNKSEWKVDSLQSLASPSERVKTRVHESKSEWRVDSLQSLASPRKKVKARVHENKSEWRVSSLQSPASSKGFNPPAGIVHEALTDSSKKSGRKRKSTAAEDDESDEERRKKDIKEDKRPRRDRLKKTNEKRTVFVGNVPLTADKKKLARLFKQFGEIESVRFRCAPVADPATKKRVAVITKEFHEKRHNISAYVCFKNEEAAKEALKLNGHFLDGLHLRVDSAKPALKNLSKRSVFVGNLPFAIEEESIRKHFEDCGDIENVRVVRDRKTNLGKGFCYILFKSSDSVSLALHLKNSELEKRPLRVERCMESSQKISKEKKMKKLGDQKQAARDVKAKKKPATTNRKPKNKEATSHTDQKVKWKKMMWQPTNASASQVFQSQRTVLKKKKRKAEKKSKKNSKTDEVTRILGPLQRLSIKSIKSGGIGGKAKTNRTKVKEGKKGKKGER